MRPKALFTLISPLAPPPVFCVPGLRDGTGIFLAGTAFLRAFFTFWGARLICFVLGAAFSACNKQLMQSQRPASPVLRNYSMPSNGWPAGSGVCMIVVYLGRCIAIRILHFHPHLLEPREDRVVAGPGNPGCLLARH